MLNTLSLILIFLGYILLWLPAIDIYSIRIVPGVTEQNFMIINYTIQGLGALMVVIAFIIVLLTNINT